MTELEHRTLVHRYRYYVLNAPTLSDYEYDLLERAALKTVGEGSPLLKPGSDRHEDYPARVVEDATKNSYA